MADAARIATSVLTITGIITKLAAEAIEAERTGDTAAALPKLEEIAAHLDAAASATRAALTRVKQEIDSESVAKRFDNTDQGVVK